MRLSGWGRWCCRSASLGCRQVRSLAVSGLAASRTGARQVSRTQGGRWERCFTLPTRGLQKRLLVGRERLPSPVPSLLPPCAHDSETRPARQQRNELRWRVRTRRYWFQRGLLRRRLVRSALVVDRSLTCFVRSSRRSSALQLVPLYGNLATYWRCGAFVASFLPPVGELLAQTRLASLSALSRGFLAARAPLILYRDSPRRNGFRVGVRAVFAAQSGISSDLRGSQTA